MQTPDRTESGAESEAHPVDAAAMARLMREQSSTATSAYAKPTAAIVATWGVVWLVGYLAVWSGETGGNPWLRLPAGVEWWVLAGLIAAGVAISATLGVLMGRGRRGPSSRAGAMYGLSFGIGTVTLMLFDVALVRSGLTATQASLLFPGTFTLLIGALYLAGGTSSRAQFVTGCALLAAVIVATFVGAPHHLLVYAIAGLVFLAGAWWLARHPEA